MRQAHDPADPSQPDERSADRNTPARRSALRQVIAVARLELRRRFTGRRALPVLGLALVPVALFALYAVTPTNERVSNDVPAAAVAFAGIFQTFIVRGFIFFGCVVAFANVFRGEIVDRTLHYYLMAPVPRWALVAGKYLAGLLATVLLFEGSTFASIALYLGKEDPAGVQAYLASGGAGHIAMYGVITALACVGYGAVFTTLGLFFRNPIVPVMTIFGWEAINFVLPPLLKRVSIVHYLDTLSPLPIPDSPFAIPAEPVAAALAVPGLLLVSAACLVLAAVRLQRMDVPYGSA